MRERETEETPIRKVKTRDISEIAAGCLTLILQLRQTHDFGDKDILRKRVRELLSLVESEAKDAGYGSEEIRMTVFALVAFLDETVLASEWAQKDEWLANSLQLEYFDRFDAGEEFFAILERLRERPQAKLSVLKIYFLCLALGFKGKYQFLEREKLRKIIEDIYSDLAMSKDRGEEILAPHGFRKEEIVAAVTREIPGWLIGALAIIFGAGFYIIMTMLLSGAADKTAQTMRGIL